MGFIFTSHSFFPFWANKFPNLGLVYLKFPLPPISLFLSLCYLLALPSLRENSDTPKIQKQMLKTAMLFFRKVHLLGQYQAPCVFWGCQRWLSAAPRESVSFFLFHGMSSVPRRLSGSQAITCPHSQNPL